jgi:hypothetical protein
MPLNPSGAISLAGPTAGQSIAVEVGQGATSQISLNDTIVRTLAKVPSGAITMPTNFWGKSISQPTQKGIFALGGAPVVAPFVNYVSNTGVVASDTPTSLTPSSGFAGASYGGDKGMFFFRQSRYFTVSNTGALSALVPVTGVSRSDLCGNSFGGDKAVFAYGFAPPSTYNTSAIYVSNTGVLDAAVTVAGPGRSRNGCCSYGGDKGIQAFGFSPTPIGVNNYTSLISNTGVIGAYTPGVGTARSTTGVGYGGDKGVMAFGGSGATLFNMSNLISNTGVVASDTSTSGTLFRNRGATSYGGDLAVYGFGEPNNTGGRSSTTNKVTNTGSIGSDTPTPGAIGRTGPSGVGYSFT